MGMEGSGGMSPADVVALQGRNNDGMFSGNGTWIWVFFLFFLLACLGWQWLRLRRWQWPDSG